MAYHLSTTCFMLLFAGCLLGQGLGQNTLAVQDCVNHVEICGLEAMSDLLELSVRGTDTVYRVCRVLQEQMDCMFAREDCFDDDARKQMETAIDEDLRAEGLPCDLDYYSGSNRIGHTTQTTAIDEHNNTTSITSTQSTGLGQNTLADQDCINHAEKCTLTSVNDLLALARRGTATEYRVCRILQKQLDCVFARKDCVDDDTWKEVETNVEERLRADGVSCDLDFHSGSNGPVGSPTRDLDHHSGSNGHMGSLLTVTGYLLTVATMVRYWA